MGDSLPHILVYVGGGLGDQVCAEPSLRYGLREFEGALDISLFAHNPWLFSHLKFRDVFPVNGPPPDFSKYVMRPTYPLQEPGADPKNEMNAVCSMHTNGVDFCSLQMFRWQLPFADRQILLVGDEPRRRDNRYADPASALAPDAVVVHAGVSWPSRTFPAAWWTEVVKAISSLGAQPVLIGYNNPTTGVVPIKGTSAIDLTGKLNLKELIYVLQRARVVVTNDSLPIHMAASHDPDGGGNDPWIGYLSTAKHPDFLMHYRRGVLGYKMENLSKGGVWSKKGVGLVASNAECVKATEEEVASWLPLPGIVARWAVMKGRE